MPTLTPQQIADLQDKLDNDDVYGFYDDLDSLGDNYARLGKIVTNNSGWQGEVANKFMAFASQDNEIDSSYGSSTWIQINKNIAQSYLNTYSSNSGSTPTWDQIQDIHNTEYSNAGLDPNDWLPNKPLDDSSNPGNLWADYITNDGSGDLIEDALGILLSSGKLLFGPYLLYRALMDGSLNEDDVAFARALLNALGSMSDAGMADMAGELNPLQDISEFLSQFPEGARKLLGDLSWGLGDPSGLLDRQVPTEVGDAKEPWDLAPTMTSPLTLDLDLDGIELTTFNATTTTTFFDIDGDGFAEQTAWLAANQDGFLARDINENGIIDGANELFGSSSVDGFALLQELDSNGDHVIDQYDSAWDDLVVWKDVNGDAVTQEGELLTLASLNIKSFDLSTIVPSTSVINGNPISHTSSYTLTTGGTGTIADAWFAHSTVNTFFAGEYTLDVRALFLPSLRGYGEIADLHIAMSENEDLLDLVEDFALGWDISRYADGASLDADIEEILFEWAGVSAVGVSSLGPNIDARRVAFLERFFGEAFVPVNSAPGYVTGGAAGELNESWNLVFGNLKAQLLVQVGAESLFEEGASYNLWSGEIEGDMDLSEDAIDDLETAASQVGVDAEAFWNAVAAFIEFSRGIDDLTSPELVLLDDAVQASDPSLTWDYIATGAIDWATGNNTSGTSGADLLNGTAGTDTLYGLGGDDEIHGGDAPDILDGGDGADTIYGDGADDTIYGGAGADEVHGGAGADYVLAGDDADTVYGDAGEDNLQGGNGNDTVYGGADDDVIYGDANDDVLYGGTGNDTLYGGEGADELHGEEGGNTLYGGNGDDTYFYLDGNDYYDEEFNSGTDTIQLPSGVDSGDLTFSRHIPASGYATLLIEIDGLGTIETPFFSGYSPLYNRIESLTFYDTSTYNLTSFTAMTTYANNGDNTIEGIYTTQDIDDTIYGLGGSDIIYGYGGADIIDGGDGNDTIYGGSGNDVYVASAGFDIIQEEGGMDTILLPEGFDMDDVSLLRHSDSDTTLEITITGLGQIRARYHFSGSSYEVESITLHDTTTYSLTNLSIETRGTSGNDSVYGVTSGASINDILDGRAGDDYLYGYYGDDKYYFSEGSDAIYESGGDDTIAFRDGWAPGSISIYRGGTYFEDLVLEDGNGNKITSMSHFTLHTGYSHTANEIEQIVFADNTTWDLSTMEIEARGTSGADYIYGTTGGDYSESDTIYGFGGNDYIYGYGGADFLYGGDDNDYIEGGDGNDVLYGGTGNDTLKGNAGDDTYVYTGGLDTVDDSGDGTDTLLISGGITINDISIANESTYDTRITITASTDEILISYLRGPWSSYYVERIAFDDGFETDLMSYGSWMWGTSGNDSATGNSSANTIITKAGNDTVNAGAGNDDVHGGSGNDTLNGGDGDDLLHGGTGDDVINGQDGLDTLYGGDGDDIFAFESASAFNDVDQIMDFAVADDALDIADLLSGFTPGVDDITEWVQITDNGTDSTLYVDANGGADNFVAVAAILGVTGLTDEAALVTAGTLVVT